MFRVGKTVPPKRQILKDISLSFFPGAKIGILGLNGAGKSSLLRIMAGVDTEFDGDASPMANLSIGYLEQEPKLDPRDDRARSRRARLGRTVAARKRLEELYAEYGNPEADFDNLAEEQSKLEAVLQAAGDDLDQQLEIAADALRLPPWDAKIGPLSGGEKRARRALPPAAVQARHAAARRTDQPPRCRKRRVARTVLAAFSRHRGRR